jgi:hypothetical protein
MSPLIRLSPFVLALVALGTLGAQSTTTTTTTTAPATPAPPPATAPTTVTQPVSRPVIPPTTPARAPITPVVPLNDGRAPTAPGAVVTPPVLPNAASATAQSVVNANGTTTTTTTLLVDPNSMDALVAGGVDVALNPAAALAALRQSPTANQQKALATLRTRVDATDRALADMRAQARANGVAGAGSNYDQVAEDIRVREDALREALRAAGSGTSDQEWRQAQSQVAAAYQAYADAVARARTLLQPAPSQ